MNEKFVDFFFRITGGESPTLNGVKIDDDENDDTPNSPIEKDDGTTTLLSQTFEQLGPGPTPKRSTLTEGQREDRLASNNPRSAKSKKKDRGTIR